MLLQLPVSTLLAVLPCLALLNASLVPAMCAKFYAPQPLPACVASWAARVCLRCVLLPFLIVYACELRARSLWRQRAGRRLRGAAGGGGHGH